MSDTLVTLHIPVGSGSVEDRVMRLLSTGKRSDVIISLFHGKDFLLIGGIIVCLDPGGSIFFERAPVVGSGTLLSEGLRFDKPRSGVLVLLHCGREGVSLRVSSSA